MVIYFTFVSLQYNQTVQDSIELSDTMSFMFLVSSFILLVFAAIFVFYSNSFFTRQRKREIGLYAMLGLRKKTIAKMMFYENLLMGLAALGMGVLFGALLSKLFAMILLNLMGESAAVDFNISLLAIIQTVGVFFILILMTSIHGYRLIYRYKLIGLFQAEKQGEQKPKVSVWSAVLGVVLLAIGYWLVLRPFSDELDSAYLMKNYGSALVIMKFGTLLFFRSVIALSFDLFVIGEKRRIYNMEGELTINGFMINSRLY